MASPEPRVTADGSDRTLPPALSSMRAEMRRETYDQASLCFSLFFSRFLISADGPVLGQGPGERGVQPDPVPGRAGWTQGTPLGGDWGAVGQGLQGEAASRHLRAVERPPPSIRGPEVGALDTVAGLCISLPTKGRQ